MTSISEATAPVDTGRTAAEHRPAGRRTAAQRTAEDLPARPTVIRCGSAAEFLAALPFLAGFTAENSLFLVLFEGNRSREAVRIDLPEREEPQLIGPLIDAVCEMLRDLGGGGGPALVITSERGFAESEGPPWASLAQLLQRRFRRERWALRELACIAPDGWVSFLDHGAPKFGRPLEEIRLNPEARRATAESGAVPQPLDRLGSFPEPEPDRLLAIEQAVAALDRSRYLPVPTTGSPTVAGTGGSAPPVSSGAGAAAEHLGPVRTGGPATPSWVDEAAAIVEACQQAEDGRLSPRECASLAITAAAPGGWIMLALGLLTRAAFLRDLAADGEAARYAEVPIGGAQQGAVGGSGRNPGYAGTGLHDEPELGWSISRILDELARMEPNRQKLRRGIDCLTEAIAHLPTADRPGPLALAAWLWWMSGLQSVAARLLAESLTTAPDHELSLMLRGFTEQMPPWRVARRVP